MTSIISPTIDYFVNLTFGFHENLNYKKEIHQWSCAADLTLYKAITEQKILFRSLIGLNPDYDSAIGRILSTKPLPSPKAVFTEINHEKEVGRRL